MKLRDAVIAALIAIVLGVGLVLLTGRTSDTDLKPWTTNK